MVCPPQSCCYCPGLPAGHPGPHVGHHAGGHHNRLPGAPLATSTPRRRPDAPHHGGHHQGGHHQSGHNDSIPEETMNEIADLESLGILHRSQMEFDIGHSAEHAVDELDLSHSLLLEAVPHEPHYAVGGDQSGGPIDQSYMGGNVSGAGQAPEVSCVCAPRGSPGGGNQSLGLMDSRHMGRNMLDAGYELDFSGPDDLGPHPMEALHDLSGMDDSLGIMDPRYMGGHMMGAGYDQSPEFHTGGDEEEIGQALETESQMTVYDAEDLNMTMAPRTNNIETRREVLYNTFTREYNDTEEEENEAVQEILLDFHQRRRNEASRLTDE